MRTLKRLCRPAHCGAWLAFGIALMLSISALLAMPSSVSLKFEQEAFDLDTATVVPPGDLVPSREPLSDYPEADFLIAYHADRLPHAVLVPNEFTGVEMAILSGIPFESVDGIDVVGLTFTSEPVDQPFEGNNTVVLKTDTGAYFKLGNPTEDDSGVTLNYENLEQRSADSLMESPSTLTTSLANLKADPLRSVELQPDLSPEDWQKIESQLRRSQYHVEPAAGRQGEFVARNRRHNLLTSFDARGVQIVPMAGKHNWDWHLTLERYGYEGDLRSVEEPDLKAHDNRLEYRRGELIEWYVNDEQGLEQGFTLAAPPGPKTEGSPLLLELRLSGSLLPLETGNIQSEMILADANGESVVRYSKIKAWDADGDILPARIWISGELLRLEVRDREASYPIVVDPTVTQVAKLLAFDGAANDYFGYSVSISGDTAVVGAPYDDNPSRDSGSAYVFERNQGGADNWGLVTKLWASDGTSRDLFGYSVAIAGDTVLVGAPIDDAVAYRSGSAYIFERNQGGLGNWGQVSKLVASDGAYYHLFGISVSMSGDTLLIGARSDSSLIEKAGSAYIFERNQGGPDNWGQVSKLTASDPGPSDHFGHAVSVSGDTALIGAYRDNAPRIDSGSAYVFNRNAGGVDNWGQVAKLVTFDASNFSEFGYSVSISENTALVGAHWQDGGSSGTQGAAYVFERDQGGPDNWGLVTKLSALDGSQGDFGHSASISGNTILIGAYHDDTGGWGAGSVYVFERHRGGLNNWGEVTKLLPSDIAANDAFGWAVSMDGESLLIGSRYDDDRGSSSGSAYVYSVEIGQNQPPIALCKGVALSASGDCSADASIDNGSYDLDGDPITLIQSPEGPYPLGETEVTLTVTDSHGASDECTATVMVEDDTPPIINILSISHTLLWPPNHKMIAVTLDAVASDFCDPNPDTQIISVSSNEPINGLGDGDAEPDWEITGDLNLDLRAERSGTGDGRIYTITVEATDESGESTTEKVIVTVPKSVSLGDD